PLQAVAPVQTMPGSAAPAAVPSQPRMALVTSWAQWDSLAPANRLRSANVVGVMPGVDPTLRDEVVLVTAHYDHIGFGRPVDGDSINNGADDDASGVIAVIEMAKALKRGPRPKRTIVFMAITGEEVGGFGTRWYIAHPVRPLDKTVVDLNVEMIAHADSLAGGFGKAWLTGYERSTMGDLLADNGIPLVPDPRPTQNFFSRSDNVAFARIGIPAHSLSSYNLISPYHHPKDEPSTIDAPHMTQVITATSRALRLMADGVRAQWHPGGKPDVPAPRPPR
ncbi:MAG: M20/M25/M40 family metallo-hydrolase, partial [Gemmatimonas sp.]